MIMISPLESPEYHPLHESISTSKTTKTFDLTHKNCRAVNKGVQIIKNSSSDNFCAMQAFTVFSLTVSALE